MYAYVDESGDPGFAFQRGSSRYLVQSLLTFVGERLYDAILIMDEAVQSGERQARFATALRHAMRSAGTPHLASVVQHRSHSDNLIQVADMVAGAVARAYERRDDRYRQLLRRKLAVLELPRETPHGPRG